MFMSLTSSLFSYLLDEFQRYGMVIDMNLYKYLILLISMPRTKYGCHSTLDKYRVHGVP